MKRNLLLTIFIFCLCQIGLAQSLKRIGTLERKNDSIFVVENGKYYIVNKNVVTVKLKSGIDGLEKVAQKIRSNRLGYIDLVVPEGTDLEKYVSVLEYTGKFDIVEYNNIGKYCVITNDTERSNQWYLNNINAFNVWDITMGSSNTTVAILDSGTDWRHPDIGNGSDGYKNINEQVGWNYISNTNNVITNNGHGTRVAGIVGAKSNNYRGISGISGGNNSVGITMIPFCVGIDAPDGSIIDDAIIDAIDAGARVIQLSLNIAQTNAINAAIDYAIQNNVVIVCASGNNYSSTVSYPASHQNVIAVGATNKSNIRPNFSNYGTSLDVVAPGVDIFSTTLNDEYNSQDGTSFAAPQVSGVAALMLSMRPDLTGQQVRNIIEQTAQKVGGYSYVTTTGRSNGTWNQEMGYGLVNAYAAVYAVAPQISGPSTICNQATYTINNLPQGATVQWNASNTKLSLVTQSADSAVFQSDYYGNSTIYATITIGNSNFTVSRSVLADINLTPLNNCYISASDFTCGTASFTMLNLPASSVVRWSCDAGIGYSTDVDPTYSFFTYTYPVSHPGVDKMKAQITHKGKTQDWEHEFDFNFNRPYVYYQVGDTILSDYGFYSNNGLAAIDVQYNYPFNWMNSDWSVYGGGWDFVYGSSEFATFEGPTGVPNIMIKLCFNTPCGGRTCYQREFAVPQSLYGISASAFSLSPNPASDNVTISLAEDATREQKSKTTMVTATSSDDSYEIQLWNSFGLVKQVTTDQPKYQLSLSGIPAGFYYVNVIKNKTIHRKQLIVKH